LVGLLLIFSLRQTFSVLNPQSGRGPRSHIKNGPGIKIGFDA
jgi:hypothetical protein